MPVKEPPLQGPIGAKITWAEICYQERGEAFLRDKRVLNLSGRLKEALKATRNEMMLSGIAEACRACEEAESGSCCGRGIENRYSGILLLINRLLGRRLPDKRTSPDSCFFLGKEGCRLLTRHVICINYLCKKVTDRIDPLKIAALREKEGHEVELLFLLNEQIREMLKA